MQTPHQPRRPLSLLHLIAPVWVGLLVLLSASCRPGTPGSATGPTTDVKWPQEVETALEKAEDNRPQLEQVLIHYSKLGDPQKRQAAEYLIANMGGHSFAELALFDTSGVEVELDVLAYPDYSALIEVVTEIEKERGELDYDRKSLEPDLENITAELLIENIDLAFKAYRERPWAKHLKFDDFLAYVLPYRGSNEPLESWRGYFLERFADLPEKMKDPTDPIEAAELINRDLVSWFTFDSRFYLHPTDQGLCEMREKGLGRCEDMTNLAIYAMRANALPVTSDYTPYWASSGNNHAWNAILGRDDEVLPFMGCEAHPGHYRLWNKLAKVYRKTFGRQLGNLAFSKPEDEAVPRWLSGRNYADVTADYVPVSDVRLSLTQTPPDTISCAFLCVFNDGRWGALQWGRLGETPVRFVDMGRDIAYLPALYLREEIAPAGPAFILTADGTLRTLEPRPDEPIDLVLYSTTKRKEIADTDSIEKVDFDQGSSYELFFWDEKWISLGTRIATEEPLSYGGVPSGALYWLVREGSRKEERIFTYEQGQQTWW